MLVVNQLSVDDDDQFWTLVHKKAQTLEQSRARAKSTNSQESEDESDFELPTQKQGRELIGTSTTNSFAAPQRPPECKASSEERFIPFNPPDHHESNPQPCTYHLLECPWRW
ncbi:uncharacterized protein A4U43_C05F3520 [Asparagus officinalis]|uniref:Uncharacterized protein n=1 Tax=Asparagus officinalis TaxID=4686 RepID=A0A5P1EQ34_ASPOF|nr:uncharacterized protein A4U43_C05F3520 [Asparagus officinalis]